MACEIGFFFGCKEGEVSFLYYLAVFSGKLDAIGRRNSSLSLSPSVASSEDGKSPCVIRIFFLLRIFPPFFPLFCAGVRSSAADGVAAFFSIEYPLLLPPCLCWGRMEIALFLPLLPSASSELHLIKREGHKKDEKLGRQEKLGRKRLCFLQLTVKQSSSRLERRRQVQQPPLESKISFDSLNPFRPSHFCFPQKPRPPPPPPPSRERGFEKYGLAFQRGKRGRARAVSEPPIPP